MIYQDGSKFEGFFENDMKVGLGTYFYSDKSEYKGEFIEDKRHGYGTYKYANGGRYVGNWANNLKHGQGVYEYEDGSKYDGDWGSDKKDGFGTLTQPDGQVVNGFWKAGNKSDNLPSIKRVGEDEKLQTSTTPCSGPRSIFKRQISECIDQTPIPGSKKIQRTNKFRNVSDLMQFSETKPNINFKNSHLQTASNLFMTESKVTFE